MNDLQQFENDLIQFKEKFLFDEKFKIGRKNEYSILLSEDKKCIIIWIFDKHNDDIYDDISRKVFPKLDIRTHSKLKISTHLDFQCIELSLENFDFVVERRKYKLKLLENE